MTREQEKIYDDLKARVERVADKLLEADADSREGYAYAYRSAIENLVDFAKHVRDTEQTATEPYRK